LHGRDSQESRNLATGATNRVLRKVLPKEYHSVFGNPSGWVMLQSDTRCRISTSPAPSPVHRNVQDPVRIRHSFLSYRSSRFCAFSEENSPSHPSGLPRQPWNVDTPPPSRRSNQVVRSVSLSVKSEDNTRLEARPALRPQPSEDDQVFSIH
jgi:hypothetical protein